MDGDHVIDQLALQHPELVVLELLQHTLGAARRALAAAHPELDDEGDLGPLEVNPLRTARPAAIA